ncbi:MAG: hypothetical protein AB4042_19525 [Leptolyngbyaceae cyanobacterium]
MGKTTTAMHLAGFFKPTGRLY